MYPAGPKQSRDGGSGVKLLEAAKNLHPTVPKIGSKIDSKHVDGYAFLMCIAIQRKISKGPKFLILKFFVRKNVYVYTHIYRIREEGGTE